METEYFRHCKERGQSQSSASGLCKRLIKRERSRDELPVQQMTKDRGKKAKKEYLKAFEFVLLSLGDEDEDEWIISDDKIMLRGLIQLSPESSEADIRRKLGCRDGAVVRALASHQCGPGSIPRLGVICGLSLLVLYSAPRGFLRVLRFPLSSKTNI